MDASDGDGGDPGRQLGRGVGGRGALAWALWALAILGLPMLLWMDHLLLRGADLAMYATKAASRPRWFSSAGEHLEAAQ